MKTLSGQLEEWCRKYISDESVSCITYMGEKQMGQTLGRTHYIAPNKSEIYISPNLLTYITRREVLWHEFCHAWQYYDEHIGGHGSGWIKRLVKRPMYFVLYIYTGFIFLIGALKNL